MKASLTPISKAAKLIKDMETFQEQVNTVLALVHHMEAEEDMELQIKRMTTLSVSVYRQFNPHIGKVEKPDSKDLVVLVVILRLRVGIP